MNEDQIEMRIEYADKELRSYRNMASAAKRAEFKIRRIAYRSAPRDLGSTNMDVTGVHGGRKGSTEKDFAEAEFWINVQRENEREMNEINRVLNEIGKRKKHVEKILRLIYIKDKSFEWISRHEMVSIKTVYNWKREGLLLYTELIFGICDCKK